ncbi:hypothetical protein [Thalassobacillus pellis]|uniref:hypothetical protein n=1 Tax=Thalassobacillus pellis TaxID=748008 RepID=UPI0019605ADC|nr:hypothetical protein [Thalassobacillus pellis]MBM7552300.1 hypothetical protein [Thalassobacillus pellis]
MKRRVLLKTIFRENGFIFPASFLIVLLLLGTTTAAIRLYENHQKFTKLQIEQMELHSLVQSGIGKFNYDSRTMEGFPSIGEIVYTFPHGRTDISYEITEKGYYLITIAAATEKGTKTTIIRKVMP